MSSKPLIVKHLSVANQMWIEVFDLAQPVSVRKSNKDEYDMITCCTVEDVSLLL